MHALYRICIVVQHVLLHHHSYEYTVNLSSMHGESTAERCVCMGLVGDRGGVMGVLATVVGSITGTREGKLFTECRGLWEWSGGRVGSGGGGKLWCC